MKLSFRQLVLGAAVVFGFSTAGFAQFCHWEANEYNNNTCYCGQVQGGPATAANCTDDYGVIVTSCAGLCSDGGVGGPFCYWMPNSGNNFIGYCGLVEGETANATNCTNDYGEIVTTCDGKVTEGETGGPFCYFAPNSYNEYQGYCGLVEGAIANATNCADGEIVTSCQGLVTEGETGGPFCYWAANEYNDNTAYCGLVEGAPANATNCTAESGEIVTSCIGVSVRYGSAGRAPSTAPLRASYARGSVTVSRIGVASGTVSLVNVRGVTVATQSIGSGDVSISARSLPAGMYFVRLNARDVSGRRVVQQSSVMIMR